MDAQYEAVDIVSKRTADLVGSRRYIEGMTSFKTARSELYLICILAFSRHNS